MHVAFVTDSNHPAIIAEEGDTLLAQYLQRRGCRVTGVPWDDDSASWEDFDVVFLRSCYNYHLQTNRFLRWLESIERKGIPIFNPPPIVRWNHRKTYLRDLESRGLPDNVKLPATIWIDRANIGAFRLKDELVARGIEKAVVKPVVGGDGLFQWIVETDKVTKKEEERLKAELQTGDLMVQQYITEIDEASEVNLIFCDGVFTNAVFKSAMYTTGSRVVQTFEPCLPDKRIVAAAEKILQLLDSRVLYARVDFVVAADKDGAPASPPTALNPTTASPPTNGRLPTASLDSGFLYLLEVELIEPSLFLYEDSVETAGQLLLKRIRSDLENEKNEKNSSIV